MAEVYAPSRRPSASRSVQPSLVPRKPFEVATNGGEAVSALAEDPSVATSVRPWVLPTSSLRVFDSAGSYTT